MSKVRADCIRQIHEREPRSVDFFSQKDNRFISEMFGERVFGKREMEQYLPKPVYASFIKQITEGSTMDRQTIDAIAHAVRVWAQSKGATHFTHWFQPQTNSTAEKHDSFLSLRVGSIAIDVTAIDSLSGSALLQAEPDASSFPHGGSRTTFEARGYTVWDPTSPVFLQQGPHGSSVLYIPSIFIGYHGNALDEKTGLLRSIEAVSKSACRLLNVLGHKGTRRVTATLGTEQEFFLIDRSLYALRPDLRMTGRTLIGASPPKHQQLEDHYFGRIPTRVLAAISEAELELWRLGVPIKTRHNEVAPNQFEVAPIFEAANIAVDHNLLTMEVIHKVAHRHSLKALFHEKPFLGVNGSGKHCNWSLSTDGGLNLLDPGEEPENNIVFLATLVSVLVAVHRHGSLLRAAVASASNDHRLGANEAPPAIVSVFLGDFLSSVLDSVENGEKPVTKPHMQIKKVSVGSAVLDVKVSTSPAISQDPTDRNRTSPFAFTGNKFEFRAVGSQQSPSFPVTVLNAAVAQAMNVISDTIENEKEKNESQEKDREHEGVRRILGRFITETRSIRFEGDNYSAAWREEAAKRGLPNLHASPEAFEVLNAAAQRKLLVEEEEIYSDAELDGRFHVCCERYAKDVVIEARSMTSLVRQNILPIAFSYKRDLAAAGGGDESAEGRVLGILTGLVEKAYDALETLESQIENVSEHDPKSAYGLLDAMIKLREPVDVIETHLPDSAWDLPRYSELFFA